MKSYYSDVDIFAAWCAEEGRNVLPATADTVSAFLEAQALGRSMSTVQRRLYSIRKAHRLMRLPDPTLDEEVLLALRRVRRAKNARPKQALALTRDVLDRILRTQPETPVGLRNAALLSLGYELLTRRSELAALRLEDVTWREDGTLRVLIPRSKADQFGQGRLAFTSVSTRERVDAWLSCRGAHISWLFCPIYAGKPIARPLGTSTIRDIVKSSAKAAGYDATFVRDLSGHSMRVGAAQDLLTAGHDTAAIMRAGGWKSVAVLSRYLEAAEHNVWN
ncbi:tyrosine-type recombinase/integrase [Silicimonas algicola]|nr:tyrosine-type recombinase/integrase [Silicimonas algicola]